MTSWMTLEFNSILRFSRKRDRAQEAPLPRDNYHLFLFTRLSGRQSLPQTSSSGEGDYEDAYRLGKLQQRVVHTPMKMMYSGNKGQLQPHRASWKRARYSAMYGCIRGSSVDCGQNDHQLFGVDRRKVGAGLGTMPTWKALVHGTAAEIS